MNWNIKQQTDGMRHIIRCFNRPLDRRSQRHLKQYLFDSEQKSVVEESATDLYEIFILSTVTPSIESNKAVICSLCLASTDGAEDRMIPRQRAKIIF